MEAMTVGCSDHAGAFYCFFSVGTSSSLVRDSMAKETRTRIDHGRAGARPHRKGKPVRPKARRVSKLSSWTALLVVHAAHAGHTAWTTSGRFVFFRQFCHQSFSHQQQPGNRSRIL